MNDYVIRINQISNLFEEKKQKKLQLDTFIRLIEKVDNLDDAEINKMIDDVYYILNELSRDETLKSKTYMKAFNELKKIVKTKHGFREKGAIQGEYTGMGIAIGVAIGPAFMSLNAAFIGIGLPIGLAIGASIGRKKEQEALEKGNIY